MPPTSTFSRTGYVAGMPLRAARLANWMRRLTKKAPGPTKSASGHSRTTVAKAESISRLVLALRTWICSPMARAAASTSLNVVCILSIGRIDEHGHTSGCWHQLAQKLQPLCSQFSPEKIGSRQIASRPSETGDKTTPDRVVADVEDDGDRRRCRLGRQWRRNA